jgi:hypothetical protein
MRPARQPPHPGGTAAQVLLLRAAYLPGVIEMLQKNAKLEG